jgi:hypothetical protein
MGDRSMARKKRKTAKRKKKSKATKRKIRSVKPRKLRRRAKRSLGDRVSGAYRTVVDTIKGADRLRNKMEPPATSETE